MKKLITIIIPLYNEAGNIEYLYNELNEKLDKSKYDFDYLFVDDGSKDSSYLEVSKIARDDASVKVIKFSRNFGKEIAMLSGLDYAKESDAGIIIDADGQMPVKYINELVEKWEEGYKLVLTRRNNRKKTFKHKLASMYYTVYNKISTTRIEQDALDFQLMDKQVMNEFTKFREVNRFFKGLTGMVGFDSYVMDVDLVERKNGESKFGSLFTLFNYAFQSIASHSSVPLKLAVYLGAFSSIIGFIYLIVIISKTLIMGIDVPGYSSIMSINLIFYGIILLVLGIIGYYISLIYDEVKGRPNYIIEEKINLD